MNNRLLAVLSIRPFFYLFLSEIFSQIAVNMMNFVLIIVVYSITHSNTAVAGMVLAFTVPSILFGMLAGIYVDRWDKRKVLFITNVLRTFLLIFVAYFYSDLFSIYVLAFIISTVTQFFIPAETPMIPLLVPKHLLISANALFGMGIYGSVLIAYALSGPFLLLFGKITLFFILAGFFLIAGFFVTLIQKRHVLKDQESSMPGKQVLAIGTEFKLAIELVVKTKDIYQSLLFLTLSQLIILIVSVIGPGYASQILNIHVEQFPILFVTPAALGMVFGALIIGNYLDRYSKHKLTSIGLALSSLGILLLPFGSRDSSGVFIVWLNQWLPQSVQASPIHIMMVVAFLLGVANALVFVPSNTILQEEASDEFRGKIYGALSALVGAVSLLPVLLVGQLADSFGVGRVLVWLGLSIGAIAIYKIGFYGGKK